MDHRGQEPRCSAVDPASTGNSRYNRLVIANSRLFDETPGVHVADDALVTEIKSLSVQGNDETATLAG